MVENKSSDGSAKKSSKKKMAEKTTAGSTAVKTSQTPKISAAEEKAQTVSAQADTRSAQVQSNQPQSAQLVANESKSGSSAVSWIALVFSLAAIAGAGYAGYLTAIESKLNQGQQANSYKLMDRRVDGFEQLQTDLGSQISQLRTQITQSESDVNERIRKIRRELDEQTGRMDEKIAEAESTLSGQSDAFRSEFNTLSDSVVNLRSELGRNLDSWVIEEAAQLISIADYQLRFTGDSELAKQALELADTRLEELADPTLLGVRSQLAKDIEKLDSVKLSLSTSVLDRLSTLSESIYDLPLLGDVDLPEIDSSTSERSTAQSVNEDPVSASSGFERFLQVVGDAFSSLLNSIGDLVQIEKNGKSVKPVISDHERQLTYERTRLFLEGAQIAYVRKDAALYGNRLGRARQWVEKHFHPEATQTGDWLLRLEEIQTATVFTATPDISESVQSIQQALRRGE